MRALARGEGVHARVRAAFVVLQHFDRLLQQIAAQTKKGNSVPGQQRYEARKMVKVEEEGGESLKSAFGVRVKAEPVPLSGAKRPAPDLGSLPAKAAKAEAITADIDSKVTSPPHQHLGVLRFLELPYSEVLSRCH